MHVWHGKNGPERGQSGMEGGCVTGIKRPGPLTTLLPQKGRLGMSQMGGASQKGTSDLSKRS